MSTAGAADLPLEIFGSFCPDLPPADLPAGLSPWCQDVLFTRGGIKTRPGLVSQFAALNGNPSVNYLKTYITQKSAIRLLVLDALGNLYKENPQGTLNNIANNIVPASYGKSTTAFGREYIAFGDGQNGIDAPRQYDDTNLDRVSQEGPGSSPNVVDYSAMLTETASPNGATLPAAVSISSLTNASGVVTCVTSSPHGFVVGQNIVIAGVAGGQPAGFWNNGSQGNPSFFVVLSVANNTTFTFAIGWINTETSGASGTAQSCIATYTTTVNHGLTLGTHVTITGNAQGGFNVTNQPVFSVPSNTTFTVMLTVSGLAGDGAGTITVIGNIPAGVHQISVIFVTRNGFFTKPSPPGSWTAAGAKGAAVFNIPTGPPTVVARVLCFTASGGANFFYTGSQSPIFRGNMVIGDNTTTSATVDFSDAVLLTGVNVDELFNLVELGECAGVVDYADRLFWWGERNKLTNFLNMCFSGGWNLGGGVGGSDVPLGWTSDPSNGAGGSRVIGAGLWYDSYRITGDGASAVRGRVSQSAFQDFRGVPILPANTAYSIRVVLTVAGVIGSGTWNAEIFSASQGSLGIFSQAFTQATATQEFIGTIVTSPPASVPSDVVLRIYVSGTATNGMTFTCAHLELFPTNQPFNNTLVRASFNANNLSPALGQESYDGVSGLLQTNPGDGQSIRCLFKMRERLYIVKDSSLYVTEDDGVNEPASWNIRLVSSIVGTPSVNGVALGEDWAVIAHQHGLFMFTGGEPTKISQEVQSNQTGLSLAYFWDNINWTNGFLLWTVVDIKNRRVLIGAPFAGASGNNGVLYLDYRPLVDSSEIISEGPIHTSFGGKTIVFERGRKWSPWTISAASAALIKRFDGTTQVFFGNNTGTGKIYALGDSQFSDDGAAINSFYTTYFFPTHEQEQNFQMGSHRKLFTYMIEFVEGSGLLTNSAYRESVTNTAWQLPAIPLSNPSFRDNEMTLNVDGERVAYQFGTNAAGSWFRLQKMVPSVKPHPIPVRGAL